MKSFSVVCQKILFIGFFISSSIFNLSAQWTASSSAKGESSVYIAVGMTELYGDIGGSDISELSFTDSKSSYALGFRYSSPSRFGFSLLTEMNNHYQGDNEEPHLDYRQMAFKSSEWDISVQLEIDLLGGSYLITQNPHHIYTFVGSGYARSKTRFLDENLVRSTDKVKLVASAPSLYGGLGYQYRLNNLFALGAEYRVTQFLSDYIDGYHPKFSKRNDMSMDFRMTFAYFFHLNLFGGKRYKCNCEHE